MLHMSRLSRRLHRAARKALRSGDASGISSSFVCVMIAGSRLRSVVIVRQVGSRDGMCRFEANMLGLRTLGGPLVPLSVRVDYIFSSAQGTMDCRSSPTVSTP